MAELYVINVSLRSTLLLAGLLGGQLRNVFAPLWDIKSLDPAVIFTPSFFPATGLGCVAPYFFCDLVLSNNYHWEYMNNSTGEVVSRGSHRKAMPGKRCWPSASATSVHQLAHPYTKLKNP